MREVLIHLGSPKTGTSFIQTFLKKNTKKLNHHDIDYPSPKKNELPKFAEVEWETEKNGFLLLNNNHLADSFRFPKTLYSEEGLFRVLIEEERKRNNLIEFFRRKNIKVKFIIFYRDFYEHSISTWNQNIKRGKTAKKYQHFMLSDEYLDLKRLNDWIKLSKKDGLSLSLYKYDLHKNDLFKFFLNNILGIEETDSFFFENKIINRSLDYSEIEFIRLLNKQFGMGVTDTIIKNLRWVDLHNSKAIPFISEEEFNKINEKYASHIDSVNNSECLEEKVNITNYQELFKDSDKDKNYKFTSIQLAQISKGLGEIYKKTTMIRDEDAIYLRNIALEIQKGSKGNLNSDNADLLLDLAKRARPKTSNLLSEEDIPNLKNIAREIKNQSLENLTISNAIFLMKLAKKARPNGPLINDWLEKFDNTGANGNKK